MRVRHGRQARQDRSPEPPRGFREASAPPRGFRERRVSCFTAETVHRRDGVGELRSAHWTLGRTWASTAGTLSAAAGRMLGATSCMRHRVFSEDEMACMHVCKCATLEPLLGPANGNSVAVSKTGRCQLSEAAACGLCRTLGKVMGGCAHRQSTAVHAAVRYTTTSPPWLSLDGGISGPGAAAVPVIEHRDGDAAWLDSQVEACP